MKKLLFFTLTILSVNSFAQTRTSRTLSLLKWLINKDQIQDLFAKSDAAAFYNKNALKMQTLITDSGNFIPNSSMKDFLSEEDIRVFQMAPPMLVQTDWRVRYSQLKTKFVTNKESKTRKKTYTIFSFSEPVFLNKSNKRVLIGEHFICGPAFSRVDLLLCEFKQDSWHLIARAVINNG